MPKTLYFPIFPPSAHGKIFSPTSPNPGIGGTDFVTIRLALLMAAARPDWRIVLVNSQRIHLADATGHITQLTCETPEAFIAMLSGDDSEIVVLNASLSKQVEYASLARVRKRVLCVSHHPSDFMTKRLTDNVKIRGVVSTGVYQYYSNRHIRAPMYHIQDPVMPPQATRREARPIDPQCICIVNLGALFPAKGFGEIAKSWPEIKERFPGVTLHVIGSSELYGKKASSGLIPATETFAAEILQFIPEADIRSGKVTFYGNMGEEKFEVIRNCDLALLNPYGWSEAFPASPLEIMGCGVPVVASDDYGMSDCMRFFPELAIRKREDIVSNIEWLVADNGRYQAMCERSLETARWFSAQTDTIVQRWSALFTAIFEDRDTEFSLPPTMPFHGSEATLKERLAQANRDIRRHKICTFKAGARRTVTRCIPSPLRTLLRTIRNAIRR